MMRLGSNGRSSTQADPWDEIWASYDAIHQPVPSHTVVPVRARKPNGRMLMVLPVLSVLLMAASTFAAPRIAARDVAAALRTADRTSLTALVDWHALLRAEPSLTLAGTDFVASLSRSVKQHQATPEGLAALVQARVGPGLPDPEVETTGLLTARLVLSSPSQPSRGIALSLALQQYLPPRWKVVAVEPLG